MKLANLLPITANIMTPEMIRYMCRHLSPDTEVVTVTVDEGPDTIENEFALTLSAAGVAKKCAQLEAEGFDGIFVDCFGDAGVRAARERVKIPVFGGFEPAAHIALGMGDRIGIAILGRSGYPMVNAVVSRAQLKSRIVSMPFMGQIPVSEVMDHDRLNQELLRACLRAAREDNVEVFVLGCTGMVDLAETLQANLLREGFDIPVVEAAQSALMMLELYVKMGYSHSRMTYMPF